MDTINRMANHFRALVREQLAEHLQEIDERNATYGPGICATHDFCDANMLMAEAFYVCTGTDDDDLTLMLNNECLTAMWGAAWDLARVVPFSRNEWVH